VSEMTDDERRLALYDTLQALHSEDRDVGGAVLLNFLTVCEWQSPDGNRWLTKLSGNHGGPIPGWDQRKLAGEVFFNWKDDDEREVPGEEVEEDDDDV